MRFVVHKGHIQKYNNEQWEKVYVQLLSDSTLRWYNSRGIAKCKGKPKRSVHLSSVRQFLAFGKITDYISNRPQNLSEQEIERLVAVPHDSDMEHAVTFFKFKDNKQMGVWSEAILSTLEAQLQTVTSNILDEENNLDKSELVESLVIPQKAVLCESLPTLTTTPIGIPGEVVNEGAADSANHSVHVTTTTGHPGHVRVVNPHHLNHPYYTGLSTAHHQRVYSRGHPSLYHPSAHVNSMHNNRVLSYAHGHPNHTCGLTCHGHASHVCRVNCHSHSGHVCRTTCPSYVSRNAIHNNVVGIPTPTHTVVHAPHPAAYHRRFYRRRPRAHVALHSKYPYYGHDRRHAHHNVVYHNEEGSFSSGLGSTAFSQTSDTTISSYSDRRVRSRRRNSRRRRTAYRR